MTMIECRQQTDVPRQQHSVAEHVAGHIADADDGEVLLLNVDADLAEMALDALPGAAGSDRHFLMVISCGSAGCAGITQPVAVLQ